MILCLIHGTQCEWLAGEYLTGELEDNSQGSYWD